MKRRILLLMMTALLSVGAWAANDLTLNPADAKGFTDWGGFTPVSGTAFTVQNWATGGWEFETALSQDDYCGVEFAFEATSVKGVTFTITFEGGETQDINVPSGSNGFSAYFAKSGGIKKMVFSYGDNGEGVPGTVTFNFTSAVVKARADGDLTLAKSGNILSCEKYKECGWSFGRALDKDKYYGIEMSFDEVNWTRLSLKIKYANGSEQNVDVDKGSTTLSVLFNQNSNITGIYFFYNDYENDDDSGNATINFTSAVVKAWGDGDLSIKVPGSTITLAQWATNDTWVFGKTLSQDNCSGIDLTFSKTEAKITLQITYANDAVQNYDIPANSTHVAVGFDFNGNISKIGFKHNDYSNDKPVSITITNAVILSSATGDEVELTFANLSNSATNPKTGAEVYTKDADTQSITLNCYTWASYWSFAPAISSDDYEKVVITFSEAIPNKSNLAIHAHENSGSDAWEGTLIGTLTGGANKATAYFRNKPGVNIDQLGFYFGWNEGETATTLNIASAKLYTKTEFVRTITDALYSTTSFPAAVDFSQTDGIKAYIAKANVAKSNVELTEVTRVDAGVPVILNGSATDYTLHYTTATTDEIGTNNLHVSNGNVTGDGTIYVLAKKNIENKDVVGFFKLQNVDKVPAGKAYLKISGGAAQAPAFLGFGGGTTGIDNLTPALSKDEEVYYDLQGRRVAQPTKGLYIVNGKKVIIK